MAASENIAEVKLALDQVTEDFFDTLDLLYQSYSVLESVMRDGFLSMSRARYHMGGTRNIGALQFEKNEMEMVPISTVSININDDILEDFDGNSPWPELEIELDEKQFKQTQKNILKDTSTGEKKEIRQRKVAAKHSGDTPETVGLQKERGRDGSGLIVEKGDASPDGSPKPKDPLKLFGVLLSPHMRQCQVSFKEALKIIVQIANVKHKLQGLQLLFKDLQRQKQKLSSVN